MQENFIQLLHDRVDELSGRLELALTRIEDLEKQLEESPGEADIVKALSTSQKSLSINTASLKIVLDLMDKLELNHFPSAMCIFTMKLVPPQPEKKFIRIC